MKQHVIIFILATVLACGTLTGCRSGRPDDLSPVGPIGAVQPGIGTVTTGGVIGR